MPQIEEGLKQELLADDPEFKALYDDHQGAKRRLQELAQKSFLSEGDELEIKQLKRHKLFLKDRMAVIVRDRQSSQVSAGG
ncbi:MAG: YdcH family protein [Thermoanaerobaculia bacterium]